MWSRESREEVIAILEMSNNVGLKSTSESEEVGTDERQTSESAGLGDTMEEFRSGRSSAWPSVFLLEQLDQCQSPSARLRTQKEEQIMKTWWVLLEVYWLWRVFSDRSFDVTGTQELAIHWKHIYWEINGREQKQSRESKLMTSVYLLFLSRPDGVTRAKTSVSTATHSKIFHFDKKWKSYSL